MWILIAHDRDHVAERTTSVLELAGHEVRRARSWHSTVEQILAGFCEVILLSPRLPGLAPHLLEHALLRRGPRRPRILLYSDDSPVVLAVQAAALRVDGCLSAQAGSRRLLEVIGDDTQRPTPTDEGAARAPRPREAPPASSERGSRASMPPKE